MNKSKIGMILYMLLLTIGVLVNVYGQQTEAGANAELMIPNEAIRLRILANSDSAEDQALKRKVRDAVNAQINEWVADLTSFDQAKQVIQSHLPNIEQTVAKVLREEKSDQSYRVQFGKIQFPTKIYGNYIYPAGQYEAVLITLGEGKGANWWCVLFPPLCFLDFSNGEAVREEKEAQNLTGEAATEKEEDLTALRMVAPSSTARPSSDFVVDEKEEKIEVKFFLKEMFKKLIP
ncbi:stage II sporulation protein R [Anoxybacillus tepidamans]|uniref:Stage II sporulation protein R n=1 Tax=Anoxybacteroides tepidamans TaxID=265948 RepID=A0A7W8INV5_9BACL|nr:stage II sporulation protein R [Anoxybacillus tepidamans]MBB5324008.1 stage II sporulation protein R [Anoxybacillus tepidamans]